MTNYSFTNALEYIPRKYGGLSRKQMQDHQDAYGFKDRNCPQFVKEQLQERGQNKIADNPSTWVVCFIPASTRQKHIRRYNALVSYLRANLGCEI